MSYRRLVPALVLLLAVVATAWAQEFLVEDWTKYPLGTKGIPPGWEKQKWGSPKYEFAIAETDGRRALHLKSFDDGSTISKEVKGKVNLKQTPILEWSWKVLVLPKGGDSCKKDTDDQAAQVFVTWPRFPEMVRSRIIGYVWDSTAAVGTICGSQKTSTVTYVVVRSGAGELGKWLTERRNVREDFKKIYNDDPDDPSVVSIAIDSNDTHSNSESFVGSVLFKKP
jgi:DUF3047 family protein